MRRMPGATLTVLLPNGTAKPGRCVRDYSICPGCLIAPSWIRDSRSFRRLPKSNIRHELGTAGKIAVTGFLSRGRMGSFDDAVRLAQVTRQPADVASVRRYRSRSGVSMNLEQQSMPDVGLFARAGIADGKVEPYEFADIDKTVAAGLSVSGNFWGRAGDTVGIAGVLNSISRSHQIFILMPEGLAFSSGTVSSPIRVSKRSSKPTTA